MTTVLSHLSDGSYTNKIVHYEFSNQCIDVLRNIHNYPTGVLVTVDEDVNEIEREFSGAQIHLSPYYKQVYPLSVCFKFVNRVADHFMICGIDEQDTRKHTKVLIDKSACNGMLTNWIDIRPFIMTNQPYKLTVTAGNNLVKAIVKYGIIRDQVINDKVVGLINKYQLSDKQRDNLILQNEEALTYAISKDYIEIVKYLTPEVIPANDEFTPYQAEGALRNAVSNGAVNACRYLLETYKTFNEIDNCLKLAVQNGNTDILSLLFLNKMKYDKGKSAFNLNIRDGLTPS